jgi:hypothetical protein
VNHLKKHYPKYLIGAAALGGGILIGGCTIVGTKVKTFVLGPTAKLLGEK